MELVPANFASERPLADIPVSIEDFPRGAEYVLVLCQGFVEADGEMTDFYCRIDRDARVQGSFLRTVAHAISAQKFVPARVDGEHVRVYMNFGIAIDCSLGPCETILLRNHGYHFEEYGPDYVSPQPIVPEDVWYEGFAYKLEWIRGWAAVVDGVAQAPISGGISIPYMMSIEVSAGGVADEESLHLVEPGSIRGVRPQVRALRQAAESLGSPPFIPGYREHRPVAMRFYESSVARGICGGPCP